MKRTQHLWLIGLGIVACVACIIGGLLKTPVQAQTAPPPDDGIYTIFTDIESDGSTIYASSSYMEDIDASETYYEFTTISSIPYWQLSGGSSSDSGGPGSSFSSSVQPGSTYTATFTWIMEYTYFESPYEDPYTEDCSEFTDVCYGFDSPSGSAAIDIQPAPQISSISPSSAYQGDRGTLTITGSNFVEYAGDQLTVNFSGGGMPFTPISSLATCTTTCSATFSYDFSGNTAGPYTLSVTNNEGTSNNVPFTVNSVAVLNPCDVTSNPHAGYSSIVSTGTTGGSGTITVSFSGAAFAAISPSIQYGPYSTPESIAAHLAALITKQYLVYGLTAKAFGPNVIYSGDSTIGTVINTPTGASFTANPSSAAASAAGIACYAAPQSTSSCAATPVSFQGTYQTPDSNGTMHWKYTWQSSTGSLSDLAACRIDEIVTYPNLKDRTYVRPLPMVRNPPSPNPSTPGFESMDGLFLDINFAPSSYVKPYFENGFPSTQRFQYYCPCSNGMHWIGDPMTINRRVYQQQGSSNWTYEIDKSGKSATATLP